MIDVFLANVELLTKAGFDCFLLHSFQLRIQGNSIVRCYETEERH